MTDDKLREACERVARRWLKWSRANGDGSWLNGAKEPIIWHSITELASPWGMDLLLDAAEKIDGIEIKYHSSIYLEDVRIHYWSIIQETSEITRFLGSGDDANRYAALIYALDKVSEVLNAEQ